VSRRHLVGYATATGLGGLAGMGIAVAARAPDPVNPGQGGAIVVPLGSVGTRTVAFYGEHQAGIVTPARQQARTCVTAFDLRPGADREALRALLRRWTAAAVNLTQGQPVSGNGDTITVGSGPASLTVTVGFGPSLFGKAGLPAAARPAALAPLPSFPGEHLDPARSDGDLGVLICADDPMVVFHAARTLQRLAAGTATARWQMNGFCRAPGAASSEEGTQRNLMGQLDGTNNPHPTDPAFSAAVFAATDAQPSWLRGGSFLVVRRIRMLLNAWDGLSVTDQEKLVGRRKDNGAPLSGGSESTPANYGTRAADGSFAIPENAHIRLASAAFNNGAVMLRRGYSYADGIAADGAGLDAGLLFMAWQADPRTGFIPVHRRLIATDALNPFIRHETSALFAMPGGVTEGQYLGHLLLEAP
jgi:deferrochelatase/peroxidase EfeB